MAAPIWYFDIAIELVTLVLSVLLLYGYLAGFRGMRSRFTRGLTAISGIFGLQAGLSIYFYTRFSRDYGFELSMPLAVVSVLGMLGVLILFYLSRQ